jgi:hypothetical protein
VHDHHDRTTDDSAALADPPGSSMKPITVALTEREAELLRFDGGV